MDKNLLIPFPMIETERLILRKLELSDAEAMFDVAKDEEVTKYLSWQPHKNIDDSINFISMFINSYETGERPIWGIALKPGNILIGIVEIRPARTQAKCEVGYWLGKQYWSKGYMTEALNSIISFCFDKLQFVRVQAVHSVHNPASGRVMQKCAMEYEGTLKKYMADNNGIYHDCKMYAIVK